MGIVNLMWMLGSVVAIVLATTVTWYITSTTVEKRVQKQQDNYYRWRRGDEAGVPEYFTNLVQPQGKFFLHAWNKVGGGVLPPD
jgi:hypothetical protein